MTEDPIELYIRAKAEWEMSRHKLAKLGQLLFRVGGDLMGSATGPRVRATGDPFRTARRFSEAAEQFGLDAWPSAEKLAAALEEASPAGEEAHRRYRALSDEVQATVGPPGPRVASVTEGDDGIWATGRQASTARRSAHESRIAAAHIWWDVVKDSEVDKLLGVSEAEHCWDAAS